MPQGKRAEPGGEMDKPDAHLPVRFRRTPGRHGSRVYMFPRIPPETASGCGEDFWKYDWNLQPVRGILFLT